MPMESRAFQPGDTVEKVGADTVLTAVWEPTEAANTHTVSFVADVTGVSQLPDAINVEHDTVILERRFRQSRRSARAITSCIGRMT